LIERHKFGQRLLKDALNSGVEFMERTMALKPVLEKGAVLGVTAMSLNDGKKKQIKA